MEEKPKRRWFQFRRQTLLIVFVVLSSLVVFTLFRLELKQWRYTSSRDYLGIVQAVVVNTLALAAFVAVTHPVTIDSRTGELTVSVPTGVIALFCQAVGLKVVAIRRIRIGGVSIGKVPLGQWRYLSGKEKF